MKFKFEPRDAWIGIYWTNGIRATSLETDYNVFHVFVCFIPFFPLCFSFKRNIPVSKRHLNW